MTERRVPPGWESRPSLYPVGTAPGGDGAILRDAVARIAAAIDGLDSADPATEQAYEAIVYAYDREAWRHRAADELYSCALVGLAVLDCLGVESSQTDTPYEHRLGTAVTAVVQVGREQGAWVDTTVPGAPLPTGPWIGLVSGPEHVVVGLDGLDGDGECHAVEGGQLSTRGKGYRISRAVYDVETRAPGQVYARRLAPTASGWRRLAGYIDLSACTFAQRAVLPAPA